MAITQARLKELLHYDPATGEFTRLKTLCGRAVAGTKAVAAARSARKEAYGEFA